MWGPAATGLAVARSQSSTQVADFVRRTVELVALCLSWLVFRHLHRHEISEAQRCRLERMAGWGVTVALGCSGLVMLSIGVLRLRAPFDPGGNVLIGVTIAALGAMTNGWFWRRYASLNREQPDAIIEAQRRLYRGKTFVDVCVLTALGSVALFPGHPVNRYVDGVGMMVVAAYLIWSSFRSSQTMKALGTNMLRA